MLEQLQELQQSLLTALASDSLTPFGSYSIDGQSVNRDHWRRWALEAIFRLNELIQAFDPYEIKTLAY